MNKNNITIILLALIVVFLLGVTLMSLESVLLPFIVAVLLSIIFDPMIRYLKSKKVPTAVSLLSVVLTFAIVIFLISLLIYSSASSVAESLPKYETKFLGMIKNIEDFVRTTAKSSGIDIEDVKFTDIIPFATISNAATGLANSFINFLTNAAMVLLFMLFILAGCGGLKNKILKAFSQENAEKISKVINNISTRVRQYLTTKFLVSLLTGTLFGLILWLFGVEFPLFWGFLAFLLNFIPNVGSFIATLFPVLFSLLQFDSLITSIILLVVLIVAQNIMGNVIEPKIMSESLNLSALLILVALIFWGWLWGIVGMLLSVPLTVSIKIIFEDIPQMKPIATLMGGPVSVVKKKEKK